MPIHGFTVNEALAWIYLNRIKMLKLPQLFDLWKCIMFLFLLVKSFFYSEKYKMCVQSNVWESSKLTLLLHCYNSQGGIVPYVGVTFA